MVEVTLIEASRRAALQEMRRDARVWVLGEDVARGGLWGQYRDFLAEFGDQRVVSTPISESTNSRCTRCPVFRLRTWKAMRSEVEAAV